jgi:hypothetical protein
VKVSDNSLGIHVNGHVRITDDTGQLLLDQSNAVHPQNLARVFARALADEHNYTIYRMAFGNGGTVVDAAYTITFKTPNDGQPPDANTWDSRLYHETFSKIADAGSVTLNPLLGVDPGSADWNTGQRIGGGSDPAGDPPTVLHVSGPGVTSVELGLTSQVVIQMTLNQNEPMSEVPTDNLYPTESTQGTVGDFYFDEMGLYSPGLQAINQSGYNNINVGDQISTNVCGLQPNTKYAFNIAVDGGAVAQISFTTPSAGSGSGGAILYGDFCQALNLGSTAWGFVGTSPLPNNSTVFITDYSGQFSTIVGAMSYGYLTFQSATSGANSSVIITDVNTFSSMNLPNGGTVLSPTSGEPAGVQNNPVNWTSERERLLTHLIFSPILKSANRALNVTYTLTIAIARTVGQGL